MREVSGGGRCGLDVEYTGGGNGRCGLGGGTHGVKWLLPLGKIMGISNMEDSLGV